MIAGLHRCVDITIFVDQCRSFSHFFLQSVLLTPKDQCSSPPSLESLRDFFIIVILKLTTLITHESCFVTTTEFRQTRISQGKRQIKTVLSSLLETLNDYVTTIGCLEVILFHLALTVQCSWESF